MTDPRFPNRPTHPDFWLLSQGLIEQDAQSDAGQDQNDLVARYIDPASIAYMADQRVFSMERLVLGLLPLPIRSAMEALYVDAFIQGVRFARLKDSGGPAVPDSPEGI